MLIEKKTLRKITLQADSSNWKHMGLSSNPFLLRISAAKPKWGSGEGHTKFLKAKAELVTNSKVEYNQL